ncbi:ABC-three component system middle component 6 [Peribacillus frigoritolerans]|uniref:ABC-three component system middle component 6 n=1 Tax=Peribacillus frigoritolerans TaxID=450367 RepID=UPI00345CA99A
MLLLNDMKPEMSIFYYASLLIKEIEVKEGQDIVSLYKIVKEKYHISLKVYSYCLDWLFLIEAAIVDKEGGVFLCTYMN